LSANLIHLATDSSKFGRWGDNYAYHIGDLSSVVLPGHDATTVGQKDFQVKKIAVPHSSAKDDASDSSKLVAANKELRALRNRLNEAEAENRRLQAQIAKPSNNPSLSAANAAAVKEEPQLIEETPRLSQ
jgi:hypothetical protein